MLDARPCAQAVAGGTPAQRAVERKLPRLQRLEAPAARRAGEPAAVHLYGPIGLGEGLSVGALHGPSNEHRARARIKGRLHALSQPAPLRGIRGHTVDHDLKLVFPLAVERGLLVQVHRGAVDPHPRIPRRAECCEEGLGRLSHADVGRGQQQEPRAEFVFEQPIDRFINTLRPHRRAAARAVHHAQPSRQHPEVVVHLRQRAHGGARRAARRPLLDGDSRREPLDPLEERLGHLSHKLSGIRGKALDIPPLPLGVERVEGQ